MCNKLLPIIKNNIILGYYFDCPGCKTNHAIYVKPYKNNKNASWTFNNDFKKPTFYPSILAKVEYTENNHISICHFFLTDGKFRFLSDCTHELAGKIIEF